MKKFLRLTCTTCKRTIDKPVDNVRFAPDKCTITLKCSGRLIPVEYLSNAQITVASQPNVTDWHQRDVTPTEKTAAPSEPVLMNTSTGSFQQLILGIAFDSDPPPDAIASLTLAVRADTPKNFRSFIFRRDTTFSSVGGVETGREQKTLRFRAYGADPDLVEVYLNGIKLTQGSNPDQFQLCDGTSGSVVPENMVSFNTAVSLPGVNQVDVIVSKRQELAQRVLTFVRNADTPIRTKMGAWENVSFFERFVAGVWTKHFIFRCDIKDTTLIDLNSIMTPIGNIMLSNPASAVPLTNACFMFAREPFSPLDRYLNLSAPLHLMVVPSG